MPGPGRGGRIPCWATSAFVTFNYGGADRVADGPEESELKETMELAELRYDQSASPLMYASL